MKRSSRIHWLAARLMQPAEWRENGQLWLSRGVACMLSLCLGLMLWQMVPHHWHRGAASELATAPMQAPPHPAPRYTDVADKHIFGAAPAPQAVSPVAMQAATNMQVDGIIFDSAGKDSIAMLSSEGNVQFYSVGQTLPDGEIVKEIDADAVVLAENGALRRLELDIKQADMSARFATLGSGGDSGRVSSLTGTDMDTSESSTEDVAHIHPAPARAGIVPVAAAAYTQSAPALSLKDILAQRAHRFAGYTGAPVPPAPPPKGHP